MEEHGVQEVQIMQQCSFDRNIVQFYGFCPSPPMLVLEFMEVCCLSLFMPSVHASDMLCLAGLLSTSHRHPLLT